MYSCIIRLPPEVPSCLMPGGRRDPPRAVDSADESKVLRNRPNAPTPKNVLPERPRPAGPTLGLEDKRFSTGLPATWAAVAGILPPPHRDLLAQAVQPAPTLSTTTAEARRIEYQTSNIR